MAGSQRLSLAPAGDRTALLPAPATGLFCCPRPLLREDARGGLSAVGVAAREEETGWLMNDSAAVTAAAAVDGRPYFTASQLEELQVQVLVFKHMLVGAPVPPELLLSVRRSFESMAARLYPHGAYGYCSYFGKKFDPEPGRCRRTDGKKWRCSKDAHPESKYCERHMHRGRNRSRKPVESPATAAAPLQSPAASTLISLAPSGSSGSESRRIGPSSHVPFSGTVSQLQSGTASLEGSSKGFRYPYGDKAEAGERGFFAEGSGSARGIETDHQLDNSSWGLMPSFPLSKASNVLSFESSYPQFPSLNDLGHLTYNSMAKQNQAQHSFLGSEFGLADPVKHSQELRPFFNEWPKTRGSWSDLEDERSNPSSFSTTQLSISIPKTSSDFSATSSSRSPPIDD